MIDKFGRVMVYVENPIAVADFFVEKVGFIEGKVQANEAGVFSVEVFPNGASDACIEFFSKSVVAEISPELSAAMPSICFSSYDVKALREKLIAGGVAAGEIQEIAGSVTINFPDVEGNYYAVREIPQGQG